MATEVPIQLTPVSMDQAFDYILVRRGDPITGDPEALEFIPILMDSVLGTKLALAIDAALGTTWRGGEGGGGGGGYATPQELIDALFGAASPDDPSVLQPNDMILTFRDDVVTRLVPFSVLLSGSQLSASLVALSTAARSLLLGSLGEEGGAHVLFGRDNTGLKYYPLVPATYYTYAEIVAGALLPGRKFDLPQFREPMIAEVPLSNLNASKNLDYSTDKLNQHLKVGADNATITISNIPDNMRHQVSNLVFERSGATTGVVTLGSGFINAATHPSLTSSKVPLGGPAGNGGASGDLIGISVMLSRPGTGGVIIGVNAL